MKVILVNNSDIGGGGEKIVSTLWDELNKRNIECHFAVGQKRGDKKIDDLSGYEEHYVAYKLWQKIELILNSTQLTTIHNPRYLSLLKTLITKPSHFPKKLQGIDIYDYQGFSSFLSQLKTKPDIIHLHNLHGDFFDLRLLPKLSSEFPIFLSIHDFWLITGYCASFFSCMEWIKGCENCSILSNVGRLFKDTSHKNWLKKRDIFINSSIHLIYPSTWAKQIIEKSILKPAIIDSRIIPHGVDTTVFMPGDKEIARQYFKLSQSTFILVMTAKGGFDNQKFDWGMLKKSLQIVSDEMQNVNILVLILGGLNRSEKVGKITIHEIEFQTNFEILVKYYQAADLYIHTSKDETFGMSILEALSCGLPVISTDSGAIPEIVEDKKTGILIKNRDFVEFAKNIIFYLSNEELLKKMRLASRKRALTYFSIQNMIDKHIHYYQETLRKEAT